MNSTSKTKISLVKMWIALIKVAILNIWHLAVKITHGKFNKTEFNFGIVLILLAAIFIWHPEVLGITIAFWTPMAFISLGFFRIILVFRLRNV